MLFCKILYLMVVILFHIFKICIADKNICAGKNENVPVKTISSSKVNKHDHLECKEGYLSTFCISPGYNRDIGPWGYRHLTNISLPWIFTMEFYIYDVQEIDDDKLTMTFDLYFKVKWMEPRSQINTSSETWSKEATVIDGDEHYLIPLENMVDLWIPAFEIHNLEMYKPQTVLRETASLRINGTKFLRYIVKVKIVLNCQMAYDSYPFDFHTCFFRVGSFYNPIEIWDCTSKVHFDSSRQRNLQYHIDITDLRRNESKIEETLSGRTWATCGFKVAMKRKKSQIFVQVYLTSVLLVALSWVSFIINPEVVPGRMGLLVTVFLMLLTLFISVKRDAPPSNDFLNAADLFVIVCIGHVFLAFLEYAFVLFWFGQKKMVSTLAQMDSVEKFSTCSNQIENKSEITLIASPGSDKQILDTNLSKKQWNRLDRIILFAYPVNFILFSIIYFSVYLTYHGQ